MPSPFPFHVVDHNPNETTGGGGCVCSPTGVAGCDGPYIVCAGNDMEAVYSPHVVIGVNCVKAFSRELQKEALAGTQRLHVVDGSADEIPSV